MEAGSSSTSTTGNRTQNAANQLVLRHRHELAVARQQHTEATQGQSPVDQLMRNLVPLAEHPGVPDYLRTAETDLLNAANALQPANGNVSPGALRQFTRSLQTYQTQAANFLNQAANNGQAKTDPSPKGSAVNIGAALVSNLAFSLPAGAYAVTKLSALSNGASLNQANRVAEGVFALTVAVGNATFEPVATRTKNAFGGTAPTLHLAMPNHSTVGPYKKIGTGLAVALGSTAIYAMARAGMVSRLDDPRQSPAGQTEAFIAAAGIAAVSALITGVVREVTLSLVALNTNSRNNANTAAELPLANHNRSFAQGVTLNEVFTNLTLGGTKLKALVTDVVSSFVGAAGLWAVNDSMRDADPNNFAQQFGKVMAAFAVFFALQAATKAIATFAGQHPGAHAPTFARSSEEILVKELEASSMGELRGALSDLARTLPNAPANNQMRTDFELASEAVGGEPLRARGGDAFARMAERLDALAMPFIQPQAQEGQPGLQPNPNASREDREMAQALTAAARSFRAAHDFVLQQAEQPVEQGVLPTSVPETFLTDAQRKLYDALAVVIGASHVESGGDHANFAPTGPTLEKFAPLMPIFAAMRAEEARPDMAGLMQDLAEVKPNSAASNKRLGGMIESTDPASRRLHDRLADGGRNGISALQIVDYARKSGQGSAAVANGIEQVLANIKAPDPYAQARAMIVQNLTANAINYADTDPHPNDLDTAQAQALVNSVRDYLGGTDVDRHYRQGQLVTAVQTGEIHVKALAHALRETMQAMDNQRQNDPSAFSGNDLKNALGAVAVDVLLDTYPAAEVPDPDRIAQTVLERIGESLAHMDGDQKAVFDAASKLNPVFEKAPLGFIPQRDAHYHPSNYNGLVNSLVLLSHHMEANGIEHTNAAGIPSQLTHKTDKTQYYSGVSTEGAAMRLAKTMVSATLQDPHMGLRYRSHDEALASEYARTLGTPLDLSNTIGLSITGFDVTDGPYIAEAMDQKMRAFPGMMKSVGEVTLMKEIVSSLQEETPKIASAATKEMFHACSERGLPLVLHCDRGTPHSKNKYADQVIGMIKDWVREVHGENAVHRPDALADSVRQDDGTMPADFPERQVKVCWAHGAGISRFTAESPDHTRELDRLLSEPDLQGHLFVDLSWDFVGHDILQNTQDLLLKSAQTPQEKEGMVQLSKALDGMIKSYKTFAQVGSQADKAQDLGDFTLSAVHRLTGSRIAQHHLGQVATFKETLKDVISSNPAVRDRLLNLVQNHGDNGNNWLNLMFRHSDKIMFGTDALAIGTKAHGEAAYAINTKVLYPVYHMFQALADNVGAGAPARAEGPTVDPADAAEHGRSPFAHQLHTVVDNVARGTYENFFQDPAMAARRALHERTLAERGPEFTAGPPTERVHPAGGLIGQAQAHADQQQRLAAGTGMQANLTQASRRNAAPQPATGGTPGAGPSSQPARAPSLTAYNERRSSGQVGGPSATPPARSANEPGVAPRTQSLVGYLNQQREAAGEPPINMPSARPSAASRGAQQTGTVRAGEIEEIGNPQPAPRGSTVQLSTVPGRTRQSANPAIDPNVGVGLYRQPGPKQDGCC